MDDDCQISISRIQGTIDSLYPLLLNNNLDEKLEHLDLITRSIDQFELKNIPVPDDLYLMQKDLKIEISRIDNAQDTLLYLSSMFTQFQSQLEPLLKATKPSRSPPEKKVRAPIKVRSDRGQKNPSEEFAHKRLQGFTLAGRRYEAYTWIDLYARVCEIMHKEHPDTFDRIFTFKGKSRLYFSKNAKDLRMAKRVPGTDIYMESNFSATRILKNTIRLIQLFGYKEEDIRLEIV